MKKRSDLTEKPHLAELKETAEKATVGESSQEKIDSLAKAFELFTEETTRLETAYSSLKKQFKSVNKELEETNLRLRNKLIELDITTYYLDSILAHITQGIIFVSLSGTITTYNSAAESLLEIKSSEVVFSNFWDVFPDGLFGFSMRQAIEARKAPETIFTNVGLKEGKKKEIEISTTFVLKEGNTKPIANATPSLEFAADFTQGVILLLRDVTEIRRLQVAANRNDLMKELGEMAAMVAHEIRNPLGGIKGFASLLERDLKGSPELRQMAAHILEGTETLNKLVTNVLNYSRSSPIQFESIDLVALLKETLEHAKMDPSLNKNVTIEFECDQKKLLVSIDPQRLKSCILNLLLNAIQAMPGGGTVTLSLKKGKDATAIVQVQDTGEGIETENLPKIFSPFFSTKPEGHGFGLAEVHKTIQAHSGTIDVQSEVGKGSTFTIKIPLKS